MTVLDFHRETLDWLLLVQYRIGNYNPFLTTDSDTIWCHREWLTPRGVRVLCSAEFCETIRPRAALGVLKLPQLTIRPPLPGSRPRSVPCPHSVGQCCRTNSGMVGVVIRQRLDGSIPDKEVHSIWEGVR